MTMPAYLKVNDTFDTEVEVKKEIEQFCDTFFVEFVVETNNKKYLKFVCRHGYRQRRRGKGERDHQHYLFENCGAYISFYKSQKDGTLKCTRLENVHCHPVSERLYRCGTSYTY